MRIGSTPTAAVTCVVAMPLLLLSITDPVAAESPSGTSSAAEPHRQERKGETSYNGAFLEPSVRGAFVVGPEWRGWAVDAGIRHAFPLSLGDLRLSYRFDRLSPRDEAGSTPHAIGTLQTHGIRVHLAIHPLYIFTFKSDWFGYLASATFVEFGLGADVHTFRDSGDDILRNTRFGWSVGAGFDVPLMDPDRGSAPWLNIVYRFSRRSINPGALGPTLPLKSHTIFAGLGWRINGTMF